MARNIVKINKRLILERISSNMVISSDNKMFGTTKPIENGIPTFTYDKNASASYKDMLKAAMNGKIIGCRKHTTTKESLAASFIAAAMKSIAHSFPETKQMQWYTSMPTASNTVLGIDGMFKCENVMSEARVYISVKDCDTNVVYGFTVGPKIAEMMAIRDALKDDDFQQLIADMRAGNVNTKNI